tara:strand:- start:188 stop:526 length:339 start_codon:yes stop_codon:yes gene_type:complete
MADLFLQRLEDSLNGFTDDDVMLVLVAEKIVNQYYGDEGQDVNNTIKRFREVDDEVDHEHVSLWTILCSQVLMLKCMKTVGDKESMKEISKGINETLQKFDKFEEYKIDLTK